MNRRSVLLGAVLLGLGSCRCGQDSEPRVIDPGVSHFGTFHGLVGAAVKGDVEGAKWIARSLQEGEVDAPVEGGDGAAAVGGGLGFLQMAEDTSEVNEALAATAVGCGECHTAAGVEQPQMGVWEHHSAGLKMVLGAVFPPMVAPEGDGKELRAARAAWDGVDGDGEARLAAALDACVACHETALE